MQAIYSRKVIVLIIISSIVKLIAAGLVELGNDEVYYWTYALQSDWNHFDHPPMVGWLIRVTTFNLHWVNEVTLRAGAVICSAISTWFIFKLGKLLENEKAGWYAALIYTFAVYTGFIAGWFILPDSPQMLFWTGALYVMAHIVLQHKEEEKLGNWLILGTLIGLAALCKVHGLYLWVGFGGFLLFHRFTWLSNWRIYAGIAVTLICLIPIVYWNIQYDFITYRFHSDRVTHTSLQWDMLGREIGGEIAYQNPVIAIFLFFALVAVLGNRIRFNRKRMRVWLLWMSVPMILLFWGIALFNPTLPHWSGPAYIPLYLMGAIYLSRKSVRDFPAIIQVAMMLVVVVLAAGISLIRYAPMNFGSQQQENYGEYCPTLDMWGWRAFGSSFDSLYKSDQQNGIMKAGSPLLVNKWFPGGHLEFYVTRDTDIPLLAVGALNDIHKFAWLNRDRKPLAIGDDAYAIVASNLPLQVDSAYGKYFARVEEPVRIDQWRSHKVVRHFYVYRLRQCIAVPKPVLMQ
ncbi:MAG: glycosyltransferase family 39 protein [Chitinophagaceae bacterium]|nr:glycosyltransferase family 39 protein [Chitinophagaceae bacterium]